MNNRRNDLGEVVLYKTEDGKTALDVRLVGETVWLTQAQMAKLFERDQSVLSRHINNVFKEKELVQKSNMQKMHIAKSDKPVVFYSLDVTISVGYRVNSKRGTQFRIWATQTLKDHLVRGYTLNERRLRERGIEMEQAVLLLSRTLTRHELVTEEGRGVLDVITRYAKSWLLLKEYDDNTLSVPERRRPARVAIDYARARENINTLKARLMEKGEASNLFGQERTEQLIGILGAIEVTLDGDIVWLSQKQMGELFDKNVRTVSEHLRNIFKEGELKKSSVIRNFRITAADGKTYDTQLYNLDVIISVGYRAKSIRNLFAELSEGVTALAEARQAKRTLRTHTIGYKPALRLG